MPIRKNTVVEMTYSLRDKDNNLLEDNDGYAPILYLHGAGNIITELEASLEGLEVGDVKDIVVSKPVVEIVQAGIESASSEEVSSDGGFCRFTVKVVSAREATPAEIASGFPIPENSCGCKPGCC
jgi:hypothetical protein